MEPHNYEFTALRGIQAGTAYYVAMCPLKLVGRLFHFDDGDVPAEFRAQRVLNRSRVPHIARYIADNTSEYILSSLTASVDGDLAFEPVDRNGLRTVGKLRIAMTAKIVLNDGQHRRAAIEQALKERPLLGDETISVLFFVDHGLSRTQQMFADLNRHAIRPTKSLGVLYDHRDRLSALVRALCAEVSFFRALTEVEKTTISNRSIKLFTLSAIYSATGEFLGKGNTTQLQADDLRRSVEFWNLVGEQIPDWRRAERREVSSAELRRDYIHSHGIALQALAIAGAQAIAIDPKSWRKHLTGLRQVDWGRSNRDLWEGRAMIGGRLNKSRNNVLLVANVLLRAMQLPLTPEGERVEIFHPFPTDAKQASYA